MNTDTQYLGIACLVPNDDFLEDNIGIINEEAQRIFGTTATQKDSVLEHEVCQVVYRIQKPIFSNTSTLKEFFNKLKEFLNATEDFNSYFFTEQEADK